MGLYNYVSKNLGYVHQVILYNLFMFLNNYYNKICSLKNISSCLWGFGVGDGLGFWVPFEGSWFLSLLLCCWVLSRALFLGRSAVIDAPRLLWQRFVRVCRRRLSLLSELKLKGSMLSGVYGRAANKNI